MSHYLNNTRESIFKGIGDLYLSKAPAGGAFDAHLAGTNTMKLGVVAPHGFTVKSVDWTNEMGFNVGIRTRETNFNKKAENYSDNTANGPVLTTGVNKISTNWNGENSVKDALYTVGSGFKLRSNVGTENFNNDALNYIDKHGFNSKKYTNGSFRR